VDVVGTFDEGGTVSHSNVRRGFVAAAALTLSLFAASCGQDGPKPGPGPDPDPSCPGVLCGEACCGAGQVCLGGACVFCGCGTNTCGDDGCGNSCGTCAEGQQCNGGSCLVCQPHTDAELCADAGKDCGPLTVVDDCGAQQQVDCGICYTPKSTSETFHFGYSGSAFTCEEKCVGAGHALCTLCASGNAGTVTYQYTSGSWTQNKQRAINACHDPVPPTFVEFGTTYELYYYSCCCLTTQRVVQGNSSAPVSCTAVCLDEGMACNPQAEWFGGKNGQQATYRRTADTSSSISLFSCDQIPPLERTINGRHEVLEKQECGCK
jgi:hypothetical protein